MCYRSTRNYAWNITRREYFHPLEYLLGTAFHVFMDLVDSFIRHQKGRKELLGKTTEYAFGRLKGE